jgi:predicted short-subunit dehydrogenase-like oxidoreductase (DUF2520 family)
MNLKQIKTIGIIGMGKVGSCLANFIQNDFNKNNYNKNDSNKKTNLLELSWICSKHFSNSINSNSTNYNPHNFNVFNNLNETTEVPDAIIICTNDDLIKEKSDDLANHFKENLEDKFIIHCAGAFGIELLSECKKYNAITVAAHPFQTFYSNDFSCLENIAWGIECEKKDELIIMNFIKSLNGKPFFLTRKILQNKALYHSVGIAASNYLAGAIYISTLLADEIGIDKNDFLKPIINQTVKNSFKTFEENSKQKFPITGPIVRSNLDTVEKHLTVLKDDTTYLNKYSYFGLEL